MKPEFEHYRKNCRKVLTAVRMPENLRADALVIAEAEGDLSGLLIEGIARVISDRKSDPDYLASNPKVHKQLSKDVLEDIYFY